MLQDARPQLCKEMFLRESGLHPRIHAKFLDKKLGYKITRIEVKLQQKYRAYDICNDESNRKQHLAGGQSWIGLHPQVLQTPYNDIYESLNGLNRFEVDHIVDIGAAYGRVGLVSSVVFPEARFTGYELVKKRQAEGNRVFAEFGLKKSTINHINVLDDDFEMPKAQIYFIYDFSEKEDICNILNTLSKRIGEYEFFLVMRGDRVESLMKSTFENSWKVHSKSLNSDLIIYSAL